MLRGCWCYILKVTAAPPVVGIGIAERNVSNLSMFCPWMTFEIMFQLQLETCSGVTVPSPVLINILNSLSVFEGKPSHRV